MQEIFATSSNSNTKVIGFAGSDKYDLIMYLACILQQMDQKVLLIDLSDAGALSEVLQDSELSQIEITHPCIMDYRGMHYIPRFEHWQLRMDIVSPYLYHENQDYNYVLVDFGFQTGHSALIRCDMMILVSDMQKHNFIRIKSLMEHATNSHIIVWRDVIACKIRPMDLLSQEIVQEGNIVILDFDRNDYMGRIQMQYSKQIHLSKVSKGILVLLAMVVTRLNPAITEDELSTAMVRAKRGR